MNIEFEKITLVVNHSEAVDIYYSLLAAVDHSVMTHWKNYPESFPANESRYWLMKKLAPFINRNPHNEEDKWADLMKHNPQTQGQGKHKEIK